MGPHGRYSVGSGIAAAGVVTEIVDKVNRSNSRNDDRVTSTEVDAGRFEREFGDAERYDDRPTRAEIEREQADYSWDSNGAA